MIPLYSIQLRSFNVFLLRLYMRKIRSLYLRKIRLFTESFFPQKQLLSRIILLSLRKGFFFSKNKTLFFKRVYSFLLYFYSFLFKSINLLSCLNFRPFLFTREKNTFFLLFGFIKSLFNLLPIKNNISHAANIFPSSLPNKTHKFTILRSPHVDKKSREQFEFNIYRRVMRIPAFFSFFFNHTVFLNFDGIGCVLRKLQCYFFYLDK